MEKFKITKIKSNSFEITEDSVVEEVPLKIVTGNKELATLLCTPRDIEDLARGFLFTSGLIEKLSDIKKVNVDKKNWTAYIELKDDSILKDMVFKQVYTSGGGKAALYDNAIDILKREKITATLPVKHTVIVTLMADFLKRSQLFLKTGAAHSAAIANDQNILAFREDIGRHNAIDKIIGHSLKENIILEDKILITSGRISSEILLKAQKCKFPVIASKGAPTNQAVKLAREIYITLVGFVRGSSMNIYSVPERIKPD
ncbi:MAG: formate dehydrogenase accessory sulfurtransferase FdhD [Candidatus Aminicenantes bacterium]|nr:formate dehydrogenase accessory sulfurtransferase FdhD [Candidatus Aminicenantes bacterium]